ncbi:MAG: tripartite tricarboxylate transporter permease [Acetobacteraceae bacterium]|nr:tripartite tricarboxylate transporter permease [Acetobacteraceae bacterium]
MSETLALLGAGFTVALTPLNLALASVGALLGTIVGALPGIGPLNAVALLLPLVYAVRLPPESALIVLAAVYYGGGYGGRIAAILLNVPGDPSSVMTTLDGHPMAKRGEGGVALSITAIGSFVGGIGATALMILAAPAIARAALAFGPADYVALMAFAFALLAGIGGARPAKTLAAVSCGLLLSTIGADSGTGIERYTFGELELLDGIDFTVVVIGLFAVAEVLALIEERAHGGAFVTQVLGRSWPRREEIARTLPTMLRSAVVGFIVGVLPGTGASIAATLAWTLERRLVDREGCFGKGDIRGVAAPETADNAAQTGAMVPMLALGIPGSGTTAVLLGALMLYNITPGPLLFAQRPEIVWGLIASFVVGNLVLLALNLPLVALFVRLLALPPSVLYPGVIVFAFAGVWAVNNSVLDLLLASLFGVLGWAGRKAGLPLVAVLLGLVLGRLIEDNIRRALALSGGEVSALFGGPVAIALWCGAALLLVLPALRRRFG